MNPKLARFLVGGDPVDLDLDAVRLVRRDSNPLLATCKLDFLDESFDDDGHSVNDVPVLYVDAGLVGSAARYPIWIMNDIGDEFTRDQAIELARTLLAAAREYDVICAEQRDSHDNRDANR